MAKFRPRLKGKGKRWLKGQSSSSNPETTKHRDAAKSRFFQENLGSTGLTSEALRKHDAFTGSSATAMEEDKATESFFASTAKTFDTFASDWSNCSNKSFSRLVDHFRSDSAVHKEMLAVLAAITEVIKSQGGNESNIEYFGALMTTLENVDCEEISVTAVLNLLTMVIKTVPQEVLQVKFSQCSKTFMDCLGKFSESENNSVLKSLLGCLSVMLRAQDVPMWKDAYTMHILDSILVFCAHTKPKVRKSAHHAVCAILKGSKLMEGDKAPLYHPAINHVAEYCIKEMEKAPSEVSTLYMLSLLKEILATFPKKQVKPVCETILKVMSVNHVRTRETIICGFQALHGLFLSQPPLTTVPSELNAQLIAALQKRHPMPDDVQILQAWLAVMREAFVNLARSDLDLCMSHVPSLITTSITLMDRADFMNTATATISSLLEKCVAPAAANNLEKNKLHISKVVETLQSGLKYQYHLAWTHVLHLLGVLFKECGASCGTMLVPCLKTLAELRDTFQFSYTNELDNAVGNAVRSMGPDIILQAIPLELTGSSEVKQEFKRSWLLPVLKENIQSSTLKCFSDKFFPLAMFCRNQSQKLAAENNQVAALSYDLLESQIWALLPSFCSQPSDVIQVFPSMAKGLGTLLSNRKDLRLIVMSSLRRLIMYSRESGKNSDLNELSKFAKNYLPILFVIYTTPAKGTDEEGVRLAALETIKVYLSISSAELCIELFERAMNKLDGASKDDNFLKESILDLLRALVSYQSMEYIGKLYDSNVARLKETSDHKEQKKYYRLLEEICAVNTDGCRKFKEQRFNEIQTLLLDCLSKAAPSSKGPRLRCLLHLLKQNHGDSTEMIEAIVPEAVLCCKDINAKCRSTAYELLNKMADKMSDNFVKYVEMVMAGLAGSQQIASAALLALASITHHCIDTFPSELLELMLDNVCLLTCSVSREIVGSALSYIKVYITSLRRDVVTASVPKLMKALIGMTDDNKRHYRTKTRDILARFVRWYGADTILALVPQSEKVMCMRLRNMRKIQERKKRQRQAELEAKKNKEEENDIQFSVKSKPKSIDEILAELDVSDSEEESEKSKTKKLSHKESKQKQKSNVWLHEDADNIVDFTDVSATQKLSSVGPNTSASSNPMNTENKKKVKDGGFKTAPDGRLIIKDDSDDSENEYTGHPKRKDDFVSLHLTDSENDISDMDEDSKSVASSVMVGRKRKLSTTSTDAASVRPPMKYQAGGSGIHRPVSRAASVKSMKKKSSSIMSTASYGTEYRSKKAKGDVKRKGMPDPYAYLPLTRNVLNKRKRMKYAGHFKNIVRSAKKGVKIGTKMKSKNKRR